MEKPKALLDSARPRNMAVSFLGVITGALLVSNVVGLNAGTFAAAASAMLILAGGNALNDCYDVEADRLNRPDRPIPSGRVGRKAVAAFSALLFAAGLAAAVFINPYCLLLAVFNSAVLAAYAVYSKKAFLLSNIAVSYLTASVFIYGALSVYDSPYFNAAGLGILSVLVVSSFFMTLSREIVKDVEDVRGDSKTGASTLPTKTGVPKSMLLAAAAGVISMAVGLTPFLKENPWFSRTAYGLFIIPADLIFISSYLKQPGRGQRLIVLGMAVSLAAFLAGRLAA